MKMGHAWKMMRVYHEPRIVINPILCIWDPNAKGQKCKTIQHQGSIVSHKRNGLTQQLLAELIF